MIDLEQQGRFMKSLSEYWVTKGIVQNKIPQIGGQELNLHKLYKSVCKKGGGQMVSHNKMWKEIVDEFGLPSTCTSASFTLKNHYQKYLLGYEQKYFFGREDGAELPELVAGRTKRLLQEGDFIGQRYIGRSNAQPHQSNLNIELPAAYEKVDHTQIIPYFKRAKMYPTMPQVKHMILSFYSHEQSQNIYAINIFTLYSVNTQTPLLFSQFPFVLDAIYTYLKRVYPPRNIFDLECIRTLTSALRNLCISLKNLQPLIDSQLTDTLLVIFQDGSDAETVRNVIDIFSSLTKVGWDCKQLFAVLDYYLQHDTPEGLETGIDLLRSLIEQKQQECQNFIKERIDFFSRLLLHASLDVRESILQIFAFLCQKSDRMKILCGNETKLLQRIIALIHPLVGFPLRQNELATCIINDLTKLPQNIPKLIRFEGRIAMIAFHDHQKSRLIPQILFRLSGRDQNQSQPVPNANQMSEESESLNQSEESQNDYSEKLDNTPINRYKPGKILQNWQESIN